MRAELCGDGETRAHGTGDVDVDEVACRGRVGVDLGSAELAEGLDHDVEIAVVGGHTVDERRM